MKSKLSYIFFSASAAAIGAVGYSQLFYVEASNGLQVPKMEKGRTGIEMGDVNGDGNVDVVSIGDHGSPKINSDQHGIMVWFGDGLGNWSLFQSGNFGYGDVTLGDVNNDGLMDIGYGMHHNYSNTDFGNQLLEVALGDGTGFNWVPWDDGLATNGETYGMFGCDFADVNNNGYLDIGSISFGCCAGVHVYLNNKNGTWTRSFGFLGGNSTLLFVFGDINGDGNTDFACGHGAGQGSVYLGDGRGNFRPNDGNLPPAGNLGRGGLSLGDVTDDGRDEMAYVTSNGGVQVWKWVGEATWVNLSGNLPVTGFRATQICDMDLDGYGDIVAFAYGSIKVYKGDGGGNWTLISDVITASACDFSAFQVGRDFDHNGYPDIVQVASENCGWSGGINRPRAFKESTPPETAWVYPKYPRGGEKFVAGSVRFLDWYAAIPYNARPGNITIDVSLKGNDGPWHRIATDVPSNGRYQWVVPKNYISNNCYLRYTLRTFEDTVTAITPNPFSIVLNPSNVAQPEIKSGRRNE